MGQHVQEVLTNDFGVDVHVQAVLAFSNEVPAVVVGLIAGVIEHKDLIQGLQGQEALVCISSGAVCVSPVLGDEGVQNAGVDHLGLDLVAVLNQGHGEGAGALQGVSGQLIEDLVVLGLLPLEVHVIVGVDGLQVINEQGQSGLAAGRIAQAIEHSAVRLFDSLLSQFFQSHGLSFLDNLLGSGQVFFNLGLLGLGFLSLGCFDLGLFCGSLCATGNHTKSHAQNEKQCDQFFHVVSSSEICFAGYCRRHPPTPLFYWSIY